MKTGMIFHTDTALAKGMKDLFDQLENKLSLTKSVNVYLAGGMAVHLYTANRVTTDIDAEFGSKVFLPKDLMVEVELENGKKQVMYLDSNYNSTFALMHEDYLDDSIPIDFGLKNLRLHILSPTDLAVSKISRFAENDREDISELVRHGLTSSKEIENRATQAMIGYVGGLEMLKINLRDAIRLAQKVESERLLKNNVNKSRKPS